jgi:hypothetical protein
MHRRRLKKERKNTIKDVERKKIKMRQIKKIRIRRPQ